MMKHYLLAFMAALTMCGCRYEMVNLPGMPYESELKNAELLYEVDGLALFAGETESDIAFNQSNDWLQRNSLFMRRRKGSGREECRLDLNKNTFRVLIDGATAEEQPDGTILVKGKKTYLNDENGESLGAAWYDLWMTPDGKVIRRTNPLTAEQLQDE